MTANKLLQVARLWAVALALSALLAAAGRRWPETPPIQAAAVLALVLLPPLAMALWLLLRWRLPAGASREGEFPRGPESPTPAQERQ
jgi:hypothetical protein